MTISRKFLLVSATPLLLSLGLGWADATRADANPAPADPSLLPVFRQFGEKAGLDALMDDFMIELVSDPRTSPYFADADQQRIKAMLSMQFCTILGGPCVYVGKGMVRAHAMLEIDEAAFNALIEDLQNAMDKHRIPFRAQNALLEKLAPMHREIINEP